MGENYNLSKSDDYEPREVTPEKRAAIIDALKHFNMIEEAENALVEAKAKKRSILAC